MAEKLTLRSYRHEHSTSHPKQDIQEDEMVRIDGKDPDYTEEEEIDWDLLDEDDFGDGNDE